MSSFLDLGLSEPIARALTEEGYEQPTPIQSQTIPHVLAGRDVVGIAQTGTGKTAAFALPILHHLSNRRIRADRRSCRVLVLSPTRELSAQIVDSFNTYGRHLRPSVALAIGGVNIKPQIRALQDGVDVLVATPGRLLDLMHQRAISLDRVEMFVLDEADRMLDMGFIHDIRKIVARLRRERQTLFFSATMPREIVELANAMLRNPVRVEVTPPSTTVERIAQRVVFVDRGGKPALLAEVLRGEPIDRALIFTRTKRGADRVVRDLAKGGLAAAAIHGNKSQNQRERALAAFRDGTVRTLVATDIAARGIDVEGISHVVNYDLPNIPESYVHRIGRTARAGAEGVAISFCDSEERAYLRDIERLIRRAIPASGQPGGSRAQQLRPRQDQPRPTRSQAARPEPARPQSARPKAATPEQNANGASRQNNGQRDGRNGQHHRYGSQVQGKPRPQQRRDAPRRAPQPPAPFDGSIGSVAFLSNGR